MPLAVRKRLALRTQAASVSASLRQGSRTVSSISWSIRLNMRLRLRFGCVEELRQAAEPALGRRFPCAPIRKGGATVFGERPFLEPGAWQRESAGNTIKDHLPGKAAA